MLKIESYTKNHPPKKTKPQLRPQAPTASCDKGNRQTGAQKLK